MKRHYLIALAIPTALLSLVACAANGGQGGDINIIPITYNATSRGYFEDDPTHPSIKTFEVRRGVSWSKLIKGAEIPINPASNNDNYIFDSWYYNDEQITDDFKVLQPMTVTATYRSKDSRFEYDTWETVIREANKGLDNLKEFYHVNTFIGLEREVEYAGNKQKVRVVAEDTDFISGSDDEVAALTFEFVNAIPGFAFDSNGGTSYSESSLRSILNDRVKNNLESIVAKKMKKVTKVTNNGRGTGGGGNLQYTDDYVFIPSLYEMNILKNDDNTATEKEGYVYSYYASQEDPQASRKKNYYTIDGEKVEAIYWTRSPQLNTNDSAWPIGTDGHTGVFDGEVYETLPTKTSLAISPCFCIGCSQTVSQVHFATDSWDNIIYWANKGLAQMKSHYTQDMLDNNNTFVGLTHSIQIQGSDGNYYDYQVRVIDENRDTLQEDSSYHATLTLQLTSVYGEREDNYTDYDYTTNGSGGAWRKNTEDNFDYYSSTMNATLNGKGGASINVGHWKNNVPFVERIEPTVQNAIREVRKETLEYSYALLSSNNWSSVAYGYKTFILSFTEYGANAIARKYYPNYNSTKADGYRGDDSSLYKYYNPDINGDGAISTDEENEIMNRRIFNNVEDPSMATETIGTRECPVPVTFNNDNRWAYSYLRGVNTFRSYKDPVYSASVDNPYCILQPTGKPMDWSAMPRAGIDEKYEEKPEYISTIHYITDNPGYRIGIVPAFCVGMSK